MIKHVRIDSPLYETQTGKSWYQSWVPTTALCLPFTLFGIWTQHIDIWADASVCCLCFAETSDTMQSGSGCHVRGVHLARLTARQHRSHPVDMRAAQGRAAGLQTHLGGEYTWSLPFALSPDRSCVSHIASIHTNLQGGVRNTLYIGCVM
jgi:hypothetical protein